MPDLDSLMSVLEKLESTDIAVYPQRCAGVRNRNSSCRLCAEACTSGAITVVENRINITPDLCIGCGICATVCPTAALEALNPSDNELLRSAMQLIRERQVAPVFACTHLLKNHKGAVDSSRIIEVTCLGRIEEAELIALLAAGAPGITLAQGNCADCPNKTGAKTIALVQSNLTTLLDAWNCPSTINLITSIPAELQFDRRAAKQIEAASGLSRRDFFRQLKEGAQTAVVDAAANTLLAEPEQDKQPKQARMPKIQKDGNLPHFVPGRRERLISHLESLGKAEDQTVETRLWGHVVIDENLCDSCRMCAVFCPTGALSRFEDTDGTVGIEQYPADCVQCRLCQDTCMRGALRISSEVPVKDLIEGEIIRYVMEPHYLDKKPDNGLLTQQMKNVLGNITARER